MATAVRKLSGHTIRYTASGSSVAAGDVVEVGSVVGVAPRPIADGETGDLEIQGEFEVPVTGTASQGAAAYWDAANTRATASSSGNTKMGVFAQQVLSADDFGRVILGLGINA